METLVSQLKELEASSLPDGDDTVTLTNSQHDLVVAIAWVAKCLLYDESGMPKFTAMDDLYRMHGYFVLPGERRESGHLSAYLQTKKGLIAVV